MKKNIFIKICSTLVEQILTKIIFELGLSFDQLSFDKRLSGSENIIRFIMWILKRKLKKL